MGKRLSKIINPELETFTYNYDETMTWDELKRKCRLTELSKALKNHIRQYPEFVVNAPDTCKDEVSFARGLIKVNPDVFLYLKRRKWTKDPDMIWMLFVNTDPSGWGVIYDNISYEIQHHEKIVDYILKKSRFREIFTDFSESLRNAPEIATYAVSFDGRFLKYLSEKNRNDFDLCDRALTDNESAYKYVGDEIKKNPKFIGTIFKKNLRLICIGVTFQVELSRWFDPNDYDMPVCLLAVLLNLPIPDKIKDNAMLASSIVTYTNNVRTFADLVGIHETSVKILPKISLIIKQMSPRIIGLFEHHYTYGYLDNFTRAILSPKYVSTNINGLKIIQKPLEFQFTILHKYDIIRIYTQKISPRAYDMCFRFK